MKNMLTPKKPQRIKPLKVKDWKDLIIDFSVAIVNGASVIAGIKSTEDALESWLNVIKDVGWETTEEELLWKLITRSMWRAIYKLVDESKSSFPLRTIAERKKLENRIQPRVVGIMNNRELNIDESFFLSPEKCGLMVDAQAFFKELLDGVIDPPQAESLVNRLPSFYVWELHDEWRAKADTYQPLYDYFKGSPFAKANTAEHEWERYRSFLQRQAQEAVFGSCFGLSQLYVPLNASYLETLQKNASNMKLLQENEAELRTHAMKEDAKQLIAVELESHLLNWLSKKNPRDAVRMVSGEPGAGKSSFAKIFAAKLANENNQKVLFIPLHRIDVSGNVIEAVGDYLLTDFTENPLKDPAANLLVIFDGLDELTETGRKYVEVAKDFVGRVDRQLIGLNRNNRCVSVLYTGRVLVTQSVQSFFESSQVLSLLPFFITESEKERYLDQNDLLEEDKRDVWWKKYGGLIGKQMSGIPESFNEERLAKLTAQPLLNYMIAITPEIYNSAAEAKSLNEIYAKLLSGIYRRDWDERQLRFLGGISEADYPLIFETIAVAAWHGMGRTVSVTEIEKVRDDGDFTIKWEAFQSGEEAGISNMLTAFYFRKVEEWLKGEERFEFTHKSFQEYLTVQRIVRTLEDMLDRFEEQQRKPHKQLRPYETTLDSWRKLCAPTAIDSDLFRFLKDEMELRFKDKPDTVLECQDMLCRLIRYVATESLPPAEQRPLLLEELRLCHNAETALLAAHSACALATKHCSEVSWGDDQTIANSWLKRLNVFTDNMQFKQYLNHIEWQDQSFAGLSLRGANLAGAKICGFSIYPKAIGNYAGKNLWWLVLEEDKENQRVLLLALECVAYREYHNEFADDINWEGCDLRKWLNNRFIENAFYSDYKYFLPVTIHTDNSKFGVSGGRDVEDKLFLLSIEEIFKYFKISEYYQTNDALVARLNGDTVWWWLRSPGIRGGYAASVYADGSVHDLGDIVSWSECAVRPAFWLNLVS